MQTYPSFKPKPVCSKIGICFKNKSSLYIFLCFIKEVRDKRRSGRELSLELGAGTWTVHFHGEQGLVVRFSVCRWPFVNRFAGRLQLRTTITYVGKNAGSVLNGGKFTCAIWVLGTWKNMFSYISFKMWTKQCHTNQQMIINFYYSSVIEWEKRIWFHLLHSLIGESLKRIPKTISEANVGFTELFPSHSENLFGNA